MQSNYILNSLASKVLDGHCTLGFQAIGLKTNLKAMLIIIGAVFGRNSVFNCHRLAGSNDSKKQKNNQLPNRAILGRLDRLIDSTQNMGGNQFI